MDDGTLGSSRPEARETPTPDGPVPPMLGAGVALLLTGVLLGVAIIYGVLS